MKIFLILLTALSLPVMGQQTINDLKSKKITVDEITAKSVITNGNSTLTGDLNVTGNTAIDGKLVISSTTSASVPCPVMTEVQRDALVGVPSGACVFNSTSGTASTWTGVKWINLEETIVPTLQEIYDANPTQVLNTLDEPVTLKAGAASDMDMLKIGDYDGVKSLKINSKGDVTTTGDIKSSGRVYADNVFSSDNLIKNPSFENPSFNQYWIVTSGTTDRYTSYVGDGLASLLFDAGISGGQITQSNEMLEYGTDGQKMVLSAMVGTTDSAFEMCATVDYVPVKCLTVPVKGTDGVEFPIVELDFIGGSRVGVVFRTSTSYGSAVIDKVKITYAPKEIEFPKETPFGDVPKLKPTVHLDFMSTNAVDTRINVLRGSQASSVDRRGYVVFVGDSVGRIDFDPITHEPKGLLVEEVRVNYALQSSNYGSYEWTHTESSPEEGYKSPEEFPSAWSIEESSSFGRHEMSQNLSFQSGESYAVSMFIRKGQYTTRNVRLSVPAISFGVETGIVVNPETGELVSSIGSPTSVKIEPFIEGWYRISFVASATASDYGDLKVGIMDGTSRTYTGDGNSDIIVWGVQLEIGTFITSPIATTDYPSQRAIEIMKIDGSDRFSTMYNRQSGTLVIDVASRESSDESFIASFAQYSGDYEALNVVKNVSGDYRLKTIFGGSDDADIDSGLDYTGRDIVAVSYQKDKYRISVNGSVPVEDTATDINQYGSVEQLVLGTDGQGAKSINGHIRNVKYYKESFTGLALSSLTNQAIVNHLSAATSLLPDGILRYNSSEMYNIVSTNPPSDGAIIYNTTDKVLAYYNGTAIAPIGGTIDTPASSGEKFVQFSFTLGLYSGKCDTYYCDFTQNGNLITYIIRNSDGVYNVYVNKYFGNVKCTASPTFTSVGMDVTGVDDYGGYFSVYSFNAGVSADVGASFLCHARLN